MIFHSNGVLRQVVISTGSTSFSSNNKKLPVCQCYSLLRIAEHRPDVSVVTTSLRDTNDANKKVIKLRLRQLFTEQCSLFHQKLTHSLIRLPVSQSSQLQASVQPRRGMHRSQHHQSPEMESYITASGPRQPL